MSEYYDYENNHADKFHDYEEDAMQGNWCKDSWNDVEDDNTDSDYLDDDYYDNELMDDDNPYNEDLGWDEKQSGSFIKKL